MRLDIDLKSTSHVLLDKTNEMKKERKNKKIVVQIEN